jgi:hypothetical protein
MIFQLFEKSCSVEQQNWDRLARKKVFKLNLLKHLMIRQFFINFVLSEINKLSRLNAKKFIYIIKGD